MGIVFLGILLKEELQRTTLDNIDNAETHCFSNAWVFDYFLLSNVFFVILVFSYKEEIQRTTLDNIDCDARTTTPFAMQKSGT